MRQLYPRLSAFRFLGFIGRMRVRRTEKQRLHRSLLVREPKVRASRGWRLNNSRADALRERFSLFSPASGGGEGHVWRRDSGGAFVHLFPPRADVARALHLWAILCNLRADLRPPPVHCNARRLSFRAGPIVRLSNRPGTFHADFMAHRFLRRAGDRLRDLGYHFGHVGRCRQRAHAGDRRGDPRGRAGLSEAAI